MSEEKKREVEVSRREFIKDAGLIAGSAAIGSIAALAAVPTETASAQAAPVSLEVFDPTGAYEVTTVHAKRLDSLEGKTICEVSNGSWEDKRTFPLIRGLLQKQFPTAKFVPFDKFPVGTVQIQTKELVDAVKAAGCQAAIVGNAG